MTDCDEITPQQVRTWHVVSMGHKSWNYRMRFRSWLLEQPGGLFYWTTGGTFWFEQESDAVWVLLNWK
jgi:hypothetical protein